MVIYAQHMDVIVSFIFVILIPLFLLHVRSPIRRNLSLMAKSVASLQHCYLTI